MSGENEEMAVLEKWAERFKDPISDSDPLFGARRRTIAYIHYAIDAEGLKGYMKRPHFTLDDALILVKKAEEKGLITTEKRDELEELIKALKEQVLPLSASIAEKIKNGEKISELQISNSEILRSYEENIKREIIATKEVISNRESRRLDLDYVLNIVPAIVGTALWLYAQIRFGTPGDLTLPLAGVISIPVMWGAVSVLLERHRREKAEKIKNKTHVTPQDIRTIIEEIEALTIAHAIILGDPEDPNFKSPLGKKYIELFDEGEYPNDPLYELFVNHNKNKFMEKLEGVMNKVAEMMQNEQKQNEQNTSTQQIFRNEARDINPNHNSNSNGSNSKNKMKA